MKYAFWVVGLGLYSASVASAFACEVEKVSGINIYSESCKVRLTKPINNQHVFLQYKYSEKGLTQIAKELSSAKRYLHSNVILQSKGNGYRMLVGPVLSNDIGYYANKLAEVGYNEVVIKTVPDMCYASGRCEKRSDRIRFVQQPKIQLDNKTDNKAKMAGTTDKEISKLVVVQTTSSLDIAVKKLEQKSVKSPIDNPVKEQPVKKKTVKEKTVKEETVKESSENRPLMPKITATNVTEESISKKNGKVLFKSLGITDASTLYVAMANPDDLLRAPYSLAQVACYSLNKQSSIANEQEYISLLSSASIMDTLEKGFAAPFWLDAQTVVTRFEQHIDRRAANNAVDYNVICSVPK